MKEMLRRFRAWRTEVMGEGFTERLAALGMARVGPELRRWMRDQGGPGAVADNMGRLYVNPSREKYGHACEQVRGLRRMAERLNMDMPEWKEPPPWEE